MKNKVHFYIAGSVVLLMFGLAAAFVKAGKEKESFKYNHSFDQIVSGFTEGKIGRQTPVLIRFQEPMVNEELVGKDVEKSLFTFYPSIKGKSKWLNDRTIQFKPDEAFKSGTTYRIAFDLRQVKNNLPDSLSTLKFAFNTLKQNYNVKINGFQSINGSTKVQQLEGSVELNDYEKPELIEKTLFAKLDNKLLEIEWKHGRTNKHKFIIKGLKRSNDPKKIFLTWNTQAIGLKKNGGKEVELPALGNFKLLSSTNFNDKEQYILFVFSDPLKSSQELKGIVDVPGHRVERIIEGNRLKIFPRTRFNGDIKVLINRNLINTTGHKLKSSTTAYFTFSDPDPEVRIVGKGTIIPNGQVLPFAFEAVGLNAIDIRIIRIHENNIPQFLQINQIDGSDELRRVGEIIIDKKVKLNYDKIKNLDVWNRHVIDLKNYISPEPGAIYQVQVGFRKGYARCDCESTDGMNKSMFKHKSRWDEEESERSSWDYYDYDEDYNDPCVSEFYRESKIKKRNILASNYGIIAKGDGKDYMIAVTDLNTTQPKVGVKVDIFNFQQRKIASGTTNSNGIVKLKPSSKPYLVVARANKNKGYLRIDNSNALSISRFDIGGKEYKKGVKGFLYTERGVWRPGDTIHLNFVLEDLQKSIPSKHPFKVSFYNPMDQLIKETNLKLSSTGFHHIPLKTEEENITGNYKAVVKIGGHRFEKLLKVETIKPNRLKIEFDFPVKELSKSSGEVKVKLKSRWLHGAKAPGLKSTVEVSLSPVRTKFKTFGDYVFNDATRGFGSFSKTIFEDKLDEEGESMVPVAINYNKTAPGMLRANFKTRVFEPSGDFSTDRFGITYHPYDAYVGLKVPKGDKARNMLLTDTDHKIKIISVDRNGELVSGRKVNVALYKMSWKWWWDESQEDLTYFGTNTRNAMQHDTITTNGITEWTMNVKYPQWGRFLLQVTDEDGHSASKIMYIDWPGWAGRAMNDGKGGTKVLSFNTDKKKYKTGEWITLNIPTGYNGRALLTLEKGSKVIDSHWIIATKGITKYKVLADKRMAPNVYAHVTLLQPHKQTKNDLPIRMYGVVPISVYNPATVLHPKLTTPKQFKPNEGASISVREEKGRDMTYTIAIVDEGLLGLTRFKTPDAWSHFNKKQALTIKTWDMYDDVVGANALKYNNLLTIGGGGAATKEGSKQSRFEPMVKFMGPYTLKGGMTKKHHFTMPNYVGEVRVMVVAGNKGRYGRTAKSVKVKKPLMILPTLPRVISPNEEVEVPVTVFALENDVKNVNVTLKTNAMVSVEGSSTRKVRFSKPGEKMVFFRIKSHAVLGKAEFSFKATGGNHYAADKAVLDVRSPNPLVFKSFSSTVEKNATWTKKYDVFGLQGTNKLMLEVSSFKPINLGKRLNYLIRYPYGCVEQTTSSVFPQVYLPKLAPLSKGEKDDVAHNVKAGIKRLGAFQSADGGLSYWPGGYGVNEWGTNYAGHFLIEAKRAGYYVSSRFMRKWNNYQKNAAQKWRGSGKTSEMTQAYRLYLLALNGNPEMGAMNRFRLRKTNNNIAKWYLAAAYHKVGQHDVAANIIKDLSKDVKDYTFTTLTYGSSTRDRAVILEVLSELGNPTEAESLAQKISADLRSDKWMNTQSTAYSLVAMAKFVNVTSTHRFDVKYRINKGQWKTAYSSKPFWKKEIVLEQDGIVEIQNSNDLSLYSNIILSGIPSEDQVVEAANGLKLELEYKDESGNKVNPASVAQGTDFYAVAKVTNTSGHIQRELALTEMFPAGWEISNARLDNFHIGGDKAEYEDIRDDRVNFFFDLEKGKSKTLVIGLNAAYKGQFYLPSVTVKSMYDHTVHSSVPGQWTKIFD